MIEKFLVPGLDMRRCALEKTRFAYFLLGRSSLQVVVAKDLQTEPKRGVLALVVTLDSCRVLGA